MQKCIYCGEPLELVTFITYETFNGRTGQYELVHTDSRIECQGCTNDVSVSFPKGVRSHNVQGGLFDEILHHLQVEYGDCVGISRVAARLESAILSRWKLEEIQVY